MRVSIRIKLIVAISILMVLVFSIAAYLFISEKKSEMADDILVNSLAFSRLTAPTVAGDYDLYLAQNSFVYFNRDISKFFNQNNDLAAIELVSYRGEILYDSQVDKEKRYEGGPRLADAALLQQVQSENASFRDVDGNVYYLKFDEFDKQHFVDMNEKAVAAPPKGLFLKNLVVPAGDKYSVVYEPDYADLQHRVANMALRITYLAILAILIGMAFAVYMSKKISNPISQLVFGVNKIAQGDFSTRVNITTRDEINYLGDAVNQMAVDLSESMEAKLYQERVANELKIAASIQRQLVPKALPLIKGLDIAAGIIPAEEIGGDMYDFLPVGEERLLMYLGDVTGHGVPAGIVSSIASALFYAYSGEEDLKKIMMEVNRVLKVKTMPNMFMTLCLMQWDYLHKSFKYVSAGHERIIHYRAKLGKAELKDAGGIALGMAPDISALLKVNEIEFEVGDFLVIYSDGIPEAWRNQKEAYGMDRLVATVSSLGKFDNPLAIKEAILYDVEQFVGDYKQMDDVTLIVVRRNA